MIDIWTAEGERLMLATIRCHTVVFFETTSLSKILRSQRFLTILNVVVDRSSTTVVNGGSKKRQVESERAIGSNKDSQKVSWLTDVDLER